ncbi:polysaccharide deacetylase family protein [Nonomuraea phyllanthi]|uniref:Polysaccharide deacetylase family protein n=1 Tax=Nonomuraea phyllanthi TaxID=2219224 RepID=A0A5C4VXP5_9ACTN|nr:polysaccharide deacetylase family protein [Nonomuraea phyllanthi]KAB8190572.1 polysaccharide deacetylase family protein [Nonomuraea phyllanthi]
MHQKRFSSGIALLALSAAGCGLAGGSPERDIVVPAEPTLIDFADPTAVPGLTTRTLIEEHAVGRYVHISYPELKNAPALNHALRAAVEKQWRDFRGRTKDDSANPRPELNVEWQLAAASPQAVAVRLRTGEYLGAGWANSTRTYWFDPGTGRTMGSGGLLGGEDAMRRLAGLVREQLGEERGPQVDRAEVTAKGDRFDSMAFNRDGDLVVEFDDCQIAPCSLGRLAVAVPERQVRPLLSAFGRRAQTSVAQKSVDQESLEQESEDESGAGHEAGHKAGQKAGHNPFDDPGTAVAVDPRAVSNRAGTVDCASAKCVALTFDDGPGPHTGELLDILREARARVTFFTVGVNAAAQPELLERMSAEGHLVANHSWAHKDLSKQPSSKIADSLVRTADAVAAAIGQRPTLVRPPYGAVSQTLRDVAADAGLALVNWDVDARDQVAEKAGDIVDLVVRRVHPGAIILMHDIRRESVDAVPDILEKLRGKGYRFVTVPELYGSAGMQAGRLYRSGIELPGKQPLT